MADDLANLSGEPLAVGLHGNAIGVPGGPQVALGLGEFGDLAVAIGELLLQGAGIAFSFQLASEGDLEFITDPSYPVLMRVRDRQSAQLQRCQVLAHGRGDRLAVVGLDGQELVQEPAVARDALAVEVAGDSALVDGVQAGELIHRQPYAGPDHPQLGRPVQHLCAEARSQRLQVRRGLAGDVGHDSIISDHQRPSHPPLRKGVATCRNAPVAAWCNPSCARFLEERIAPIPAPRSRKEDDMLPARTKVIMVIAGGVGIAAGALTYLASRSLPQALLNAGTATGSSADLLRQFISTEPGHSASDRANNQDDDYDGVDQRRT